MTYVIGVGGPIGAGKSVVADELAVVYDGARRSFGGAVRRRAELSGRPLDRSTLQQLGDEIIATEGWSAFCREALGDREDDAIVVIDGIRHRGAIDGMVAEVGEERFRLVFVDAPRDDRLARVMTRDRMTELQFATAESHSNESELPVVRDRADVKVPNAAGADLASTVRTTVTMLDATGFDAPKS